MASDDAMRALSDGRIAFHQQQFTHQHDRSGVAAVSMTDIVHSIDDLRDDLLRGHFRNCAVRILDTCFFVLKWPPEIRLGDFGEITLRNDLSSKSMSWKTLDRNRLQQAIIALSYEIIACCCLSLSLAFLLNFGLGGTTEMGLLKSHYPISQTEPR